MEVDTSWCGRQNNALTGVAMAAAMEQEMVMEDVDQVHARHQTMSSRQIYAVATVSFVKALQLVLMA